MRRRRTSSDGKPRRPPSFPWSVAMSATPLARRNTAALAAAAACWGVATAVSKRALDDLPPLALLPIQLTSSVAVLAVLMTRRGVPLRGSPALLGRLGILNPGLAYALSLLGLAYISASLSVVMWALEPILILTLAAVVLREQVTRSLVALSGLAAGGMVLVIYDPAVSGHTIGIALTLAGIGCCAVYTIVARRFVHVADSTAQVVLTQQAYGLGFAVLLAAAAAAFGGTILPAAVTPIGLASAVSSGVLYYAAAYWLYLGALREVPASVASASFYLIPVFGVGAGFVFLNERLDATQSIGAAIVVGSVIAIATTARPDTAVINQDARAQSPDPASTLRSTSGDIRGR
jgi:probable blue pigment (indigoidine) exporter